MNVKDWINLWILFAPDGNGGGSGGGADDEDDSGDESETSFSHALERRNNDAAALARDIWGDILKLRRKNARLTNENTELRKSVRTDGSTVISKEDAALFESFKALNLKPDAIKTTVDERGQYQRELTKLQRELTLNTVAGVAGYKPSVLTQADALSSLAGKTLTYEVKDETDTEGKPVKVAYVKDGDTVAPLHDFAKSNWGDLLPSLVVETQQNGTGSGTQFPPQHQGSGGQRASTPKAQTTATLDSKYPKKTQ